MKKELDSLMQEYEMDALLVTGAGDHNSAMVYFTGGAHLTQADLIKPRGQTAVLFHGSMERDEAAKTGLNTRSYLDYPVKDFIKEADGEPSLAMAFRYRKMLRDTGITSGRIALYGKIDLGKGYGFFSKLQEIMPEITLIGYQENDLLLRAMLTKDDMELERIRKMGEITTKVVGMTADFLSNLESKDDFLVDSTGAPVTIGAVRRRINLWLAENGAENPEGTIFAMGRDAGFPHSSGNDLDFLRLGQPIVFDIFPCEEGGGYYYDMTRTWCLGYAPDSVLKVYEEVKMVYDQIVSELRTGARFSNYQQRTCELFEALGHPSVMSDPKTEVGYTHSIGHGVGLNIHERPSSGLNSNEADILAPGSVITIEPGLYYPDQGIGIRLENTLAVEEKNFRVLADYPMDLVIPVRYQR
ncbi:MAG: aminopeptidase P family protein [Anaerolineaceae bacterium]|nr:aminopeptidase P family protein [Anaerolineaceae bacterium]